jgi:flagellar biosynthetic protein FliO
MDTSLVALLVRVVVSLGVVLAIMAGAAAVLRRSGVVGTSGMGKRGGLRRRAVPMEVIARHGLSRSSSVTVLRVGGRALVIGVTEHQVSLLTEIDPAELEAPPESPDAAAGPGPGIGAGALPWKVALEQLRERTIRRS